MVVNHPTIPARPAWADVAADADLVMYRASYTATFQAALRGAVFVFGGLMVLGLGEWGSAGHGLPMLLFRMLAWLILAVIPWQAMACVNFRCLAMYGLQPSWRAPVSLSPVALKDYARQRGLPRWKAVMMPYMFYLFCFLIFTLLIVLPVGSPREHLGLVFIFGVGQTVVMVVGDECMSRCLPPLERTWGVQSGPYTCGVSFIGYIVVIASYTLLRSALKTKWLGLAMPPLLSAFELWTVRFIGNAFRRDFVMSRKAREAYRGTQQSMYVCMSAGMLHNFVECGRLTLIIYDLETSGKIGNALVCIGAGLVCNIASRSGWMHKAGAVLFPGCTFQTNVGLLLQDMKFPLGYVRFLTAAAIVAVRKALGNSAFPSACGGWGVLACLIAEVIEDVLVLLLARLGLHAAPVFETLTWEQALERAKRCRAPSCWRFSLLGSSPGPASAASREVHVVPGSLSPPSSTEDKMEGTELREERLLAELLVEAHHFSTDVLPSKSSPVLPGWAHFSMVYTGMFALLLSAIFILGGVDFILGFSDAVTDGARARAVLWWPLLDPMVLR